MILSTIQSNGFIARIIMEEIALKLRVGDGKILP